MDADWEVEIGGGAPVIEAAWAGFIDLRSEPDRVGEICEAAEFAPLGRLLRALNAPSSSLWSSKCDLWEPGAGELACYVDLLPVKGRVFADWHEAEMFCRAWVGRLERVGLQSSAEVELEASVELVVRAAIAGQIEGFGVTAYLSAKAAAKVDAEGALAAAMEAFADALPTDATLAGEGAILRKDDAGLQ